MFCTNPKCKSRLTKNPAAIKPNVLELKKKDALQKSADFTTHYLPDKFKAMLTEAHTAGSQIMESLNIDHEPLETALMVEEHRWFWKPEKVKFIFVAESHVRTTGKEVRALIDPSRLPKNMPKDSPPNFVKLVYCLGYGEPSLLFKPNLIENNAGTRQYVDLFEKLSNFNEVGYSTNMEHKVAVLRAFKEKGLWLLDASVHACYLGKDERLSNKAVRNVVGHSWEKYVRPVIDYTSVDPSNVWVVGPTVLSLLSGKCINDDHWLYQPRAWKSSAEKQERIDLAKLAIEKTLEKN